MDTTDEYIKMCEQAGEIQLVPIKSNGMVYAQKWVNDSVADSIPSY